MRKKTGMRITTATPTLIAEDAAVVGELRFSGSLEIEGEVSGAVLAQEDAESCLRVLDKGIVRGEIRVAHVLVRGRVEGDIHASAGIELGADAVVEGNVYYTVLEVEKGAQINGSLVKSEQKPENNDVSCGQKASVKASRDGVAMLPTAKV